jgi:hypothetical protein
MANRSSACSDGGAEGACRPCVLTPAGSQTDAVDKVDATTGTSRALNGNPKGGP